ncbi:MAG: hypothetical protein OEY29_14860 [Gammaproteobacteria bacterium]|nr:hypothetical protein [Gammaproteobacteria bacterium]
MNVLLVILLSIVFVGLIFYVLKSMPGMDTKNLSGPPLIIAIILVLLTGLSFYLLSEKSIYVVIQTDERVLQKRAIGFTDDILDSKDEFVYSSVTSGIPHINYYQQVKDFLSGDATELCRSYMSQATGSGRYKREARAVSVCLNKEGIRWRF